MFGMSLAQVIIDRVKKRDSALRRRLRIEETDERNAQIRNYAMGKACDFSSYLAPSVFLMLILAEVPLRIILLVILAY